MTDGNPNPDGAGRAISRRTILAAAAATASVTGIAACGGNSMSRAEREQPANTELEIANETLVNNFCRDWSLRDVVSLRPYLAEDLLYQVAPGQPLIESRAEFEQRMGGWLRSLDTVRWEILRSHVIGPVVLNERIDYFNAPEGGKMPSMRFHVVGHFFIEDGVIKVWKDWPIPGAEQFIG